MKTEVNFELNDEEQECKNIIMDRVMKIASGSDVMGVVRDRMMQIGMSLAACHNHACKLDLKLLASTEDHHLIHDVLGIDRHLDKEALELKNAFHPRCAARS